MDKESKKKIVKKKFDDVEEKINDISKKLEIGERRVIDKKNENSERKSIVNINEEFLTDEEKKQIHEEETLCQVDELYDAIYKDSRECNEMYKTVKYKLYYDSIREIYNQLKENRISEETRDFELVRLSARKTALILLNEIYKTTKDKNLLDHFDKLFAIVAAD